MKIGLDAKRIVRNGTGLGSYGRNLANDLAGIIDADTRLLLYAPRYAPPPIWTLSTPAATCPSGSGARGASWATCAATP